MQKDFIKDYLSYTVIKFLGPLIRLCPLEAGLFFGRRLGDICYVFDRKHTALVCDNIRTAFEGTMQLPQAARITREFYRGFGQNLIEIFYIPSINERYFKKYISIRNKEFIYEGFKKGKGVIFLGVHGGNWELSNIICANLGFPFYLFIREQAFPRLNRLLTQLRIQKGCKVIQRQNQTRQLIEVLRQNSAIGMTADQGGKKGTLVQFFGKEASMSSGAIRLALKYGVTIIPVFYRRIRGPYFEVLVDPPFEIKETGDTENDIRSNLQRLVQVFEKFITLSPREYLWSYKIWKYGRDKRVLVLHDGKTGHLRQCQAMAGMVKKIQEEKGGRADIRFVEIKPRNSFLLYAWSLKHSYIGKPRRWGLEILKRVLDRGTYESLAGQKPDLVISCGSSAAAVNYLIAAANRARSAVIMRPSLLPLKNFNLVVMPAHDDPPRKKNVVVTQGALNLMDQAYLQRCAAFLASRVKITKPLVIGLLIGGDAGKFVLSAEVMGKVVSQIKKALEKHDAEVLLTTSRRTSAVVEELVSREFAGNPRCKFMVIANKENFPDAMGGILASSHIVITTPESISMISEAVTSKKYVIVFEADGLKKRHMRFLELFAQDSYIRLVKPDAVAENIEILVKEKPDLPGLHDTEIVQEALQRVL